MPSTVHRVPANTAASTNRKIAEEIAASVVWYARHPDQIDRRLKQLDREWDVERLLQANASSLAFAGTVMAMAHHRRWMLLPALVSGFLFQHAVQGWCPPIPALRRLGFRTAREIDTERTALKVVRGDFARIRPAKGRSKRGDPLLALRAARA
ncbi:MAG TPA: hypothetical protein VHG27_06660 [Xanthobacteraceae bacterium]|nr:hypothetical protein [Xanthobacteraceae bacterium]